MRVCMCVYWGAEGQSRRGENIETRVHLVPTKEDSAYSFLLLSVLLLTAT